MLLVAAIVVLVTSLRPPEYWQVATNRGKVIKQRDANPCKEGNALAIGCESEGRGFESW